MDQLTPFADNRLLEGCIFCSSIAETRDHVPSKAFLDRPYPENLPVVGACLDCNRSFSQDEEYLACLIECALAGSTDPAKIKRESISKTLTHSSALRERLQKAWSDTDGPPRFNVESERVINVMLKLARGHAAFELSQSCQAKPSKFWCGLLTSLPQVDRDLFESVHFQQILGEVGSRNMQRLLVTQIVATPVSGGNPITNNMLINDWIDVQEGQYRYQAIDDQGQIIIRIVISEYLACEAKWAFR